ncbi:O-antigen ligase family protein [Altererythrobacter sp. MF3-039]|uniref:O-antigen ligase family protein n=1 Tax=Altererythrobacter sp. MF3-039 TaxID=3252901 RepID=UPI00390C992D
MATMQAPSLRVASRSQTYVVAAFVALAMLLGGGGSPNPSAEVALQLAAAIAVAAYWWFGREQDKAPLPLAVIGVSALVLAVPIAQLIPLPPQIWHDLPGRSREIAALALVDAQDSWMPLSIAPHKTLASLLAMIPPLALAWMVATRTTRERGAILGSVALMALAGAILGTLQMAGPGDGFKLYADAHPGWLTGFHANRNAAADILLIGAVAAAGCYAISADRARWDHRITLGSTVLVLGAALLFTGSRAGIALVPIAAFGMLVMFAGSMAEHRFGPWALAIAAISALVILTAGLALFDSRLAYVATRFGMTDDFRLELWQDSFAALSASWPWGTGMGTFVEAFLPYERLDVVDLTMPNRAHNEYLEFAIEAGIPGLLVLVAIAGILVHLAIRAWHSQPQLRAAPIFGLTSFILIALHALVDYPLRNMAEACLAGVALGMLVRPRDDNASGAPGSGIKSLEDNK